MGEKGNIVEAAGIPAAAGSGEALITTVVSKVGDIGSGIAGHAADVVKDVTVRVVGDRIDRYATGIEASTDSGPVPPQAHRSDATDSPETSPPPPTDDPNEESPA